MWLYDLLAGSRNLHGHRMLSAREVIEAEPGLSAKKLLGAALYFDAQMDDARLCLEVALSAREAGARLYPYTRAVRLIRSADRVVGVEVEPSGGGPRRFINGRVVVNASGPWKTTLDSNSETGPVVRYIQGSHLVVPPFVKRHAVVISSPSDGRIFFVIPWKADNLIGTTDLEYDGSPDDVRCTDAETDYLLKGASTYFPDQSLSADRVVARFSGIRLLSEEIGVSAARVSRAERIDQEPGLLTMIGGKFTTHRAIAEKIVDRIMKCNSEIPWRKSITATQAVLGGELTDIEGFERHHGPIAESEFGLDAVSALHVVGTYGSRYRAVLEACRRKPALARRLIPGVVQTRAEVVYAVTVELARTLEDVLRRRLGLALGRFRRDTVLLKETAEVAGELLGWDESRKKDEIARYLASLN